jgi:hypothetical protein
MTWSCEVEIANCAEVWDQKIWWSESQNSEIRGQAWLGCGSALWWRKWNQGLEHCYLGHCSWLWHPRLAWTMRMAMRWSPSRVERRVGLPVHWMLSSSWSSPIPVSSALVLSSFVAQV